MPKVVLLCRDQSRWPYGRRFYLRHPSVSLPKTVHLHIPSNFTLNTTRLKLPIPLDLAQLVLVSEGDCAWSRLDLPKADAVVVVRVLHAPLRLHLLLLVFFVSAVRPEEINGEKHSYEDKGDEGERFEERFSHRGIILKGKRDRFSGFISVSSPGLRIGMTLRLCLAHQK